MAPVRVAVLMGGRSSEHEISLASAQSVIEALDPARYEAVTVEIGRDGRWALGSASRAELERDGRSAAETLSARVTELSEAVKTNADYADKTLSQLLATTNESLGKSAAATTRRCHRSRSSASSDGPSSSSPEDTGDGGRAGRAGRLDLGSGAERHRHRRVIGC